MIPNDLQNLIMKYNESGIMYDTGHSIYWFNGKRFEFWHREKDEIADIYYVNNNLYQYHGGSFFIFKHKDFFQIDKFIPELNTFQWHAARNFTIPNNKQIVTLKHIEMSYYQNDEIICKNKIFSNGFGAHQNIIYFFDSIECLKYDCTTKLKVYFKIPKFAAKCQYFNDLFYFFHKKKCVGIFNPHDDTFHESTLLIQ